MPDDRYEYYYDEWNRPFWMRPRESFRDDGWGRPVDLEGRPVERTKAVYPYSYSSFVVWRSGPNKSIDHAVYTDRLADWDRDKFRRLAQKHLGHHRWDNAPAGEIQAFLREWNEDPELALIAVMEHCNVATGYPTWSLHFKEGRAFKARCQARLARGESCGE